MRNAFFLLWGLCLYSLAWSQSPDLVRGLELTPNRIRAVEGELSGGRGVALPFTTSNGTACFPATDQSHFSGHHIWYSIEIPAHATLEASLHADRDLSLYAYLSPEKVAPLPPEIGAVLACEASHQDHAGPGRPEVVSLTSDSVSGTVIVGVVGANGLKSGSFALNLGLKVTAVPDPAADADRPPQVTPVEVPAGMTQTLTGDLSAGKTIPLEWAATPEIACFPGAQYAHYRGRHLFFLVNLPARSELVVELAEGNNMNLYGLQDAVGVPPVVERCILCESSHTDGPGQVIRFTAINDPAQVLVGLAGASWVQSGAYQLNFKLNQRGSRSRMVQDDRPPKVVPLKLARSTRITESRDIAEGKEVPLDWASLPAVNCFPAAEAGHFRGRQVFYTLDLPAYSELVVRLRDAENLNLYGLCGYNGRTLPPDIAACTICKAGYADDAPQVLRFATGERGRAALIAVSGVSGVLSGSYNLDVHLIDRRPEDLRLVDEKPAKMFAMRTELGKAFATRGNLAAGKQIPLGWAEPEALDCFSASAGQAYRGNHVFYVLDMPAHSRLLVKLQAEANINLYAIGGHDGKSLPPQVREHNGCAAGFIEEDGWKRLQLRTQDQPQKVLVGVAGARHVRQGDYRLVVQVTE
ncbi:MAG: hypothetical protein AAF998_04465 [Bacteroidota bacterium]